MTEFLRAVQDTGKLVTAPQEIEVEDRTSALDHQMLQCSLQFASSVLSSVKA